jgi:hypothetical protein
VVFKLASVAFTLRDDCLVQRPPRKQRSSPQSRQRSSPQSRQKRQEQTPQTPLRRCSGRTHAQVTPRPEGQRRGGHPPPRARGQPPVEHFDLRGTTARQVQALRFVEVARWFPPQRDTRASEGFYTPLHENFYRAYVDSGIAFRPQRFCRLVSLVAVIGE